MLPALVSFSFLEVLDHWQQHYFIRKSDEIVSAQPNNSVWKQKVETIGEKIRFEVGKLLKYMARPDGFEPPTLRFEV